MIIFVAKAKLVFGIQVVIIWRLSTSDQKNTVLISVDVWTRRLLIDCNGRQTTSSNWYTCTADSCLQVLLVLLSDLCRDIHISRSELYSSGQLLNVTI